MLGAIALKSVATIKKSEQNKRICIVYFFLPRFLSAELEASLIVYFGLLAFPYFRFMPFNDSDVH